MHTLFRLILFKLYWESGVAKWQSHLHDWQDGSAMTYYYETAPLPTALAWYLHHAPVWWHHFESWATLAFELGVPFAIFVGFRRVRLAAAAILTGFQLINVATANYGFFCYLAVALHVFLLDDADVARLVAARALPPAAATGARLRPSLRVRRWQRWAVLPLVTAFVALSAIDALVSFGDSDGAVRRAPADSQHLRAVSHRQHLPPVRPHHARAHRGRLPDHRRRRHLDRARIPPQAGRSAAPPRLRRAPPATRRFPALVLWPRLSRAARPSTWPRSSSASAAIPQAVQTLFATPPSPHPKAARIVFWQYHFTSAAERRATGAWWTRQPVDMTEAVSCAASVPRRRSRLTTSDPSHERFVAPLRISSP